MKAFVLLLVFGMTMGHAHAEDGADVPLQPFKIFAQQFLEAVAAQDYDRAFELTNHDGNRVLKPGDVNAPPAAKKRFLDRIQVFTGYASWVVTNHVDLMAVRHDDANVTVWIPMKDGRLVVDLVELRGGQIFVNSFSVGQGPVMQKSRLP